MQNNFQNNKYTTWYFNIINSARNQHRLKTKTGEYFELHHILPKCAFPQYSNLKNNPWNGILLTTKEHYICHWLLIKMAKTREHEIKFSQGLYKMLSDKRNSRDYSFSRYALLTHLKTKGRTEQHNKKLSDSRKGKSIFKDSTGKTYISKIDDQRVLNGELVGITKGIKGKPVNKNMIVARNSITGEIERIPKELFDGIKFVGVMKGIKHNTDKSTKPKRVLSQETKEKLSKATKGRAKTEEWKQKNRKPKSEVGRKHIGDAIRLRYQKDKLENTIDNFH